MHNVNIDPKTSYHKWITFYTKTGFQKRITKTLHIQIEKKN